jgi:glycosyltransferase involved in cell wall biosynthesis
MRILYLHQYFVTPRETGGTRSYEMAKRWAKEHEVVMITSDQRPAEGRAAWRSFVVDGIEVHACRVPYSNRMGFVRRLRAFGEFAWRAGRKAVELKGDVLFATSTPLTIALPGVYASKRLRIPMVFEVRDLWPEVPIAIGAIKSPPLIVAARELEKFAYRHSSRIVALSVDMAAGVINTGYPASHVHVVPNSADNVEFQSAKPCSGEVFSELPQLCERPFIAYCGTLGEVNGVGYLAEVAAEALKRGVAMDFLVVGDGKERDLVERRARETGVLGRNFWMHRPVSKSDVRSVFVTAVASCSTVIDIRQLWANSANKFFDCLAAGRPVIVNHEGWQAELINKERCGLVIPAGDPGRAAIMIGEFFSDPVRIAEAGSNASRLAREQFDRDVLSARLLDILSSAVSDGGSERAGS